MAEFTGLLALSLQMRVWVDWVDTDSNPADGLSRDGVHDRWTLTQGWQCFELPATAPALRGTPFHAVASLLHWAESVRPAV